MIDPSDFFAKHLAELVRTVMSETVEVGKDVRAVVELDILDGSRPTEREAWHVEIRSKNVATRAGAHSQPSLIIEMDREDWARLLAGALHPRPALIDGRLSIAGDVGLGALLLPLALGVLDRAAKLR